MNEVTKKINVNDYTIDNDTNKIICDCYKEVDEDSFEKLIPLDEFKDYIDSEGYLSGCDTGEVPDEISKNWSITIDEFFAEETYGFILNLIEEFLNK